MTTVSRTPARNAGGGSLPAPPHPNLYLVDRGALGGWTLETMSGHPVAAGLASRDAARDAAWAAGYREGGTLKDGTEWFGYVPGAVPTSPLRGGRNAEGVSGGGAAIAEATSAIVAGLVFAAVVVDALLTFPVPA